MTFDESVAYLQSLLRFGMKLGNERIEALLARLGNPHRRYGIVHIAGTKGKGSTTFLASAILQAHGVPTGGYFSPYVYDVRERITLGSQPISREAFANLVSRLRPHAEAIAKTPLGPVTEFEMKTAMGFLHFAETNAEAACVEVGIGGRLDATNVVTPWVSIITNIGLDHTEILGPTHAAIAAEKAGIVKPGRPVVTACDHPEAIEVIATAARNAGSELFQVGEEPDCTVRILRDGGSFHVRTPRQNYPNLFCALRGGYQQTNAACALAAAEIALADMGIDCCPQHVRRALATASLPGRFEIARERPLVILDGAHNAMAAEALCSELARLKLQRLIVVLGMLRGHEPEGVLAPLSRLASRVIVTAPDWKRALPAEELERAACAWFEEVRRAGSPRQALAMALEEATEEDTIVVTGSFYTVGEAGQKPLA